MTEHIQTIIVGGGQAGLAAAYSLGQLGRESLILEQADRPASAWSSQRWDSFTLVTPNWSVRLPGATYTGSQPDGYMNKAELIAYFEDYAARCRQAELRLGVQVRSVELDYGGYRVKADGTEWWADNVIIATGMFQRTKMPGFAVSLPPDLAQIPSGQYRSPQALAPGAVLVVGSGQSGCQIADDLYRAGRKVYLSAGNAGRAPRRYRGRDIFYWLIKNGYMEFTADKLPSPLARFAGAPHLTGRDGGRSLNLHQFYRDGVTLLGHLRGFEDGRLLLAPDLAENLARTDQFEANLLQQIDALIARSGIDAPQEDIPILQDGYSSPSITELDLKMSGISSIIWASGHTYDYSLVKLDVFDPTGYPLTQRCATRYPGLYFLGQPWLTARKSGFLIGVGQDAAWVAEQISARV
jgi:putative flavoprotein involved in K+ transport